MPIGWPSSTTGVIVAEGTADELKRQVAGDVVTLGIDGDPEHVLATVRGQPFVREATSRGRPDPPVCRPGRHGRAAAPPRPRRRRASRPDARPSPGRASTTSSSARPAARCARSRRHDHGHVPSRYPSQPTRKEPLREDPPRQLADLPPLDDPDAATADLDHPRADPADPVPGPVRAIAQRRDPGRRRRRQRLQLVRARACSSRSRCSVPRSSASAWSPSCATASSSGCGSRR